MLLSIILIMLISREFTYSSTLLVIISFNPFLLVVANILILLVGIVLIVLASKIGIWWYRIYYDTIDEVNRKASSKLGFEVEEVFAQEAVIRKFVKPNFMVWILRIFGFIFCGISGFDILGLIIHMR